MNISDMVAGETLVRLAEDVGTKAQQGITWRVVEIKRTNIIVEPANGGARLRVPADLVEPATDEQATIAESVPYQEPLVLGEVVTITGTRRNPPAGQFVVIAIKAETYNVAKLGGDGNRYMRGLRRDQLVKVDI